MSKKITDISAEKTARREETLFEFIFCCLSCWLLSVGVGLLFDAQFEIESGFVSVLWQTLVSVIVIILMSRKWWLPLIYVGAIAILGGGILLFSGRAGEIWESVKSFIGWWMDFLPEDSGWYKKESFYIIHALVNFGVSLLFFTVCRVTRKAWPVALLSLGIVICIYMFGYIEYNVLAIPFIFVGLFPLLAMEKFQGHRIFSKKNLFGILGNRWLLTLVSCAVCIIIALSSVLTLKDSKPEAKNRFCSDAATDVQTVANFYTAEQQGLRMSLRKLGLQSNTKYIGGSLYEIKSRVIATTDLTQSSLVKVTSFDNYDGQNWTNKFDKTYRISGPWVDQEIAHLSGEALYDDFLFATLRNFASHKSVTITLKEGRYFLPYVGQVINYTEQTPTVSSVVFDSKGQIFSFTALEAGYSYTTNSFTYHTASALTPQQKSTVKSAITMKKDPLYTEEFIKHYTELVNPLPQEAVTAIDMMDIDPENPYDTAYKLASYFSSKNGYVYTKKPVFFEKDDDIVSKLFKTKQGHCVYYATAMVSMARHMGIPSRLVAGYKTVPGADGYQVIDVSSPYAWVECYIPNMGWITYDPAPQASASLIHVALEQDSKPDEEKPKDTELEKGEEEEEKKEEEEIVEEKKFPVIWVIIGVAAFILLIILSLLIRSFVAPKAYDLEKVRRKYIYTKQQAEFYWQDILRMYKGMGYVPMQGETILELTERVCSELIYHNGSAIMDSMAAINGLHYGDEAPTDAQIDLLSRVREMLIMEAKWKMKPIPYFFKRRVFLPTHSKMVKKYK